MMAKMTGVLEPVAELEAVELQVASVDRWFATPRFAGIERLYSARQVVEQRGTLMADYPIARRAADAFHARLRELFDRRQSIVTFGPYSPGQAVVIKRLGIEGIYLGGWATSAKGSAAEDPGADLASYPLSQVPDEAAGVVRALLAADKNQAFARARMTAEQLAASPAVDYRPFIIADADTGHGGDAHVRNLIRRFVEAGVPGYHLEDQKPGVKKCGHQGGKVLVSQHEQIQRLNAARFQLDIMGVPGIIVARTDAEAATLLDGCGDERDQAFMLGVTNPAVPTFRSVVLATLRGFFEAGAGELTGYRMFAMSPAEYDDTFAWLERAGVMDLIQAAANQAVAKRSGEANAPSAGKLYDEVLAVASDRWQAEARLMTYREAVAEAAARRAAEGGPALPVPGHDPEAIVAGHKGLFEARREAAASGLSVTWDPEAAKTPDGYYQVRGGLEYAIAKSIAAAPFADLIWMETATADLDEAEAFATAIHARFPDKMLAYNLSPSFNWDTTGMSDDDMRDFTRKLGSFGFVFNFITYGGHQIDGLAAEEFGTALQHDGILALARLQRELRLRESPYRTPQSLVGGQRLDAALMAASGRTATTNAMGKGSTEAQHRVQTEVPPALLDEWLDIWRTQNHVSETLRAELRPVTGSPDLLQLRLMNARRETVANITFADTRDRRDLRILSVRDQNLFDPAWRNKRLMTLTQLFLIHRCRASSVHYMSPTEDNRVQTGRLKDLGIFDDVNVLDEIIVAGVSGPRVTELLSADRVALRRLIAKG
ncbi:MAG TPA: isocitrate lyase/phosphoenolpyruvate mutase family protein [Vicinamibacterales bacterium]|nr:isocitrate lyase/phosphoenolpyruvate mutase family protein [Vicinamibacterales bacterium]